MDWPRILAYITGTVDQELLARNEYLVAEKLRVQGILIAFEPELSRRCPVVDPDDHHKFVLLG